MSLKVGPKLRSTLIEKEFGLTTEIDYIEWQNKSTDEYGGDYSKDGRKIMGFGSYTYTGIYKIKPNTNVICDLAFNNYENDNHFLKGVHIPASVFAIGKGVFAGCNNDFTITCDSPSFKVKEGILYNYSYSHIYACVKTKFKWLAIKNEVKIIDEYSFYSSEIDNLLIVEPNILIKKFALNPNLIKKIIIPKGKKGMFEQMIPDLKGLLVEQEYSTKVSNEDLANAWTDEYGVKYSADRKRLLEAPRVGGGTLKDLHDYSIKEGTIVICDDAFCELSRHVRSFRENNPNYMGLNKISIPQSVNQVGRLVFSCCDDLESIFIPFGERDRFEAFLQDYKDKLVERDS